MTVTRMPNGRPVAPPWPHCAHGADPVGDPIGCRGRRVDRHPACLEHLTDTDLSAYLSSLAPGSRLDHRGTLFSERLLGRLLEPLRDSATGRLHMGGVDFGDATFSGIAEFGEATFSGDADFRWAAFPAGADFSGAVFTSTAMFTQATFSQFTGFFKTHFSGSARFERTSFNGTVLFGETLFTGIADFSEASFSGDAKFDRARFSADARFRQGTFSTFASFDSTAFSGAADFGEATFTDCATFGSATCSGPVDFIRAAFADTAYFGDATFAADTRFHLSTFAGSATFGGAVFESASQLGPLVCEDALDLSRARFGSAVTIEVAAARVLCNRTRWDSAAALRVRYATINLSDAVLEYPVSVTARVVPFSTGLRSVPEGRLAERDSGVRMASLQGVDAAHLVLHGVDLSRCILSGTVHLDQLTLEGQCFFATVPTGFVRRGLRVARWTPRRTLIEEHHWRATRGVDHAGWTAAPARQEVPRPVTLAPVYRQLRKSFEDGKHEPGAADFYYGEMEMRRHADDIPWSERSLLTAYWALSGYGLRASRALAWLLGTMAATILVMMLWGLPAGEPQPAAGGRLIGQDLELTFVQPAPVNPTGPFRSRLTTARWEKSLRIVVNSVVFRSSGQDLTTTGTYTEMASRLSEPVLLGLAVLAIRGRLKR
ncbi:pentapeptide repeat-containing protein [Streptomyces sp. NPDC085614]|uniref:pentapeptide repeat-containing protein n=1 Tax=Streptomyces sp. NPDC085614 TaxID=3365733 RepID=UPI0037D1285D